MTNQDYIQLEKIRRQFKNLENSLFNIKKKLFKKEGFWFVKWHSHEQKKLLNDPEFARIDTFVGAISSNIESWLEYNSITSEFMLQYNAMRDTLESKIGKLKNEIIEREPTFWETISDGFRGFFKFLISKLPRIVIKYLTGGEIDIIFRQLTATNKRFPSPPISMTNGVYCYHKVQSITYSQTHVAFKLLVTLQNLNYDSLF